MQQVGKCGYGGLLVMQTAKLLDEKLSFGSFFVEQTF